MKKSSKILFSLGAVTFSALLLCSCTASFCSESEKGKMLYIIEPGVTEYYDSAETITLKEAIPATETVEEIPAITITPTQVADFPLIYKASSRLYAKANKLVSLEAAAQANGYVIPDLEYWAAIDDITLNFAYDEYVKFNEIHVEKSEVTLDLLTNTILKEYGYAKYCSTEKTTNKKGKEVDCPVWEQWNLINEIAIQLVGAEKGPSRDFENFYVNQLKNSVANYRSCITTKDGYFGSYGDDGHSISIDAKSWKYAWKKGFIEGLLVYPVAWMIDKFAGAFGYDHMNPNSTHGVAQILSILIVTIIVRGLLILLSLKSTIAQQKMTQLQPELAKIQAKYPNSNTNQAQKQRLAQEQMMLYKKHKINPMSSLLVMIFQFPIFIAVWGAMTGSAVLSSGSFLGLKLSDSIGTVLTRFIKSGGFKHNAGGWWTALVLFILMGVAQYFSMKLPQFIQKAKNKKLVKLGKNPAQDQNNKTMKLVSTFMLIMIIVMGFSLPSGMGVYWLIGALISIAQTGIMQIIMAKKDIKKKHKK